MNEKEEYLKSGKLSKNEEYNAINVEDIEDNTEIKNKDDNQLTIETDIQIMNQENNNNKIKSPMKKLLKKFFTGCFYCLFSTSVFLYILSLEGCQHEEIDECLVDNHIDKYVLAGVKLLICCIIVAIIILLQILLKLTKINYVIFIIPYIILFLEFQGVDLKNHGTYNMIVFLFVTPFISLYFFIIYYMFYSFYKKKFIRGSIILFLFTLKFFIYFYFSTCENFYKGLGDKDIENDINTDKCYMIRPNKCSMKFLDPFFDLSNLKGDCKGKWNKKKRFLKYLNKDLEKIDHFYYPRIEDFPYQERGNKEDIFNYVYNNIGGVKENPKKAERAEVFLDFENNIGNITIKLKRNETLIKERKILAEKNDVKFDNVYIFYIDALSRNHFLKRMKKIKGLLEEMLYSNKVENNNIKNDKYKRYNSYQFIKYQNMPGTTIPNMFPLFYGVSESQSDKAGIPLTKFFKEKGFITANSINSCYRDLFNWPTNLLKKKTFENFDHENIPMFCDTNFLDPEMIWAYQQGENAVFRKCIYGKDSYEYMFEYMTQFLEAYKDERKYMRMCFSDAHEPSQHLIKHIDEPLFNFLNLIFDKYSNDKTAIIFLSDHGGKIPGPYAVFFVEEWKFESELSLLFLILPENNNKYDKNIVLQNEKRFLSCYDVYSTLLDYINVNKSEINEIRQDYGQSLLTEIDGMKRDCKSVGLEDCYCHNYK